LCLSKAAVACEWQPMLSVWARQPASQWQWNNFVSYTYVVKHAITRQSISQNL